MNFVGTLYSLGATLSFTVAHASIVRLRMLDGAGAELLYRARPNLRVGGVSWPLFAFLGGPWPGASFLVLVVQNPPTRWVGLGWMVAGLVGYVVYRPVPAPAAARDREGASGVRAGARARVPQPPRAGDPASRRTPRWTSPAGWRPSGARGSSR